jgi:nitrate/TMAO reductase-like tetraheme cytochrome c subunit
VRAGLGWIIVGIACGAAAAATPAGHDNLGPLFNWPPSPPGFQWLHALPILAALPAVGILGRGLLRGRLHPALAAAGVAVFPLAAYALGMFLIVEESKGVEFCGSCHVMSPIVRSLNGTEGLAALHFRTGRISHDEACYICHSGYGIWGTFDAKMAGLRHMLHTVTGNYDTPLKLHGSFDINSCLSCHARAEAFRAVEAHQDPDLQNALVSREMSCVGICHDPPHPETALNGERASR